jgi:hypothetical protein
MWQNIAVHFPPVNTFFKLQIELEPAFATGHDYDSIYGHRTGPSSASLNYARRLQ